MSTEKPPSISIIIPAYNEEKYIGECLSSIFGQKMGEKCEVIVVDNNSTDATRRIASLWDITLISEPHPGVSAARNTGAITAQAKILYFVDADCRVPQGGLEKIFHAFLDDGTVNVVAGPYVYDLDGFLPKFATESLHYFSGYHTVFKLLFGVSQFSGGNFAIRKHVLEQAGGFDESICNQKIALPEDLDLAIKLHDLGINKMIYDTNYKIYSSFRRMKKSPIKNTLMRFFAMMRLLNNKRIFFSPLSQTIIQK